MIQSRRTGIACALAAVFVGLGGCKDQDSIASREAVPVGVVVASANYPLHYFVQRIGAGAANAVFLVPRGEDPAFWEPTAEHIELMQGADVILLNGAGYEAWLSHVSLPANKIIDTSADFHAEYLDVGGDVSHHHGPGGEHTHGDVAFTTWMDLSQAIAQAKAVEGALIRAVPAEESAFQGRSSKLTAELAMLDMDYMAWGESMGKQPILGSHPVYQYFARRYGLNMKSVHWEPDQAPDETALAELDALLKQHPAKLMLWEGEPTAAAVHSLKERGIASVVVSPCGNQRGQADFMAVMRQNLKNLQR